MNIGEILYFFRKNSGVKQREILQYYNSSVYSKIESGKREIRYSDLISIIEQLSITPEELFNYAHMNKKQEDFITAFRECIKNPLDLEKKQQLFAYDFDWSERKNKTLRELSNYVTIHTLFSNYWEDMSPIGPQELDYIFKLLSKKTYFLHYDYALLSNTIYLYSEEKADQLLNIAFPVKDEDLRNIQTKDYIKVVFNNIITVSLHKKRYAKARQYLSLAKKQQEFIKEIDFNIVVQYLDNLIEYISTGRYQFIKKVYNCIDFLKEINQFELAKNIEIEVESLTLKEENYPIAPMMNILVRKTRK